jgi:hypothetical protein
VLKLLLLNLWCVLYLAKLNITWNIWYLFMLMRLMCMICILDSVDIPDSADSVDIPVLIVPIMLRF